MIIGDVSGKGLSAALLMARLLSDVRHAFARDQDPARVLEQVNQAILANAKQGMFATASCLLVDIAERRLEVSSAGHLPLTHRTDDGSIREIGQPSGPPLGVVDTPGYATERYVIGNNETFVGYSDGAIEPRNPHGIAFGVARLHGVIGSNDHEPEQLIEVLHAAIDRFTEDASLADDLTVLVFRSRLFSTT